MALDPLPRITIVTPSFQQARYLERTLRSVLDQGYPNLEYIVIDGGSVDGSVEIIQKYAGSLGYWHSRKDRGQSDAINQGLRRASGDIVGWLNSDDTLAPGSLHRIARAYLRHPEADLIYGQVALIDAEDRILRRLMAAPATAHDLIHFNRNIFAQPGTTWRRSLQDRIGVLDESLHYTMDCDFWIRAAKAGKMLCLPYHLANLRQHEQTKSGTQHDKFVREHEELNRRYGARQVSGLERLFFELRRRAHIPMHPGLWAYKLGRK